MAKTKLSTAPVPAAIVRQIRALDRKRQPLNLSAVKRAHPRLLEKVYALRPFAGWKRALEASGLSYETIQIELEEFVVCRICGAELQALSSHLHFIHELTPSEYSAEFPGAELLCEELRARMRISERHLLPHWEPLWSPEYVLDRIAEYRAQGCSVNLAAMDDLDVPLLGAANKYFGSWDEALRRAGLDPRKERARPAGFYYPTAESVCAEIQRRVAAGWSLNHTDMVKDEHRDIALRLGGDRFFGSWDGALRAAGIDPATVRQRPFRFPTAQEVVRAIQERQRAGGRLNADAIQREDGSLMEAGRRFFSSWDAALRAAGCDPAKVRLHRVPVKKRFPECAALLAEIQRLHAQGTPLDRKSMVASEHSQIFFHAAKVFGTWFAAVAAAGLRIAPAGRTRRAGVYPDAESVVAEIVRRARAQLPLNVGALYNGEHRDASLHLKGKQFFGSWKQALAAANIDPGTVIQCERRYRNAGDVLAGIRRRQTSGLSLRIGATREGPHADVSLIKHAGRFFGSWPAALRAAGVPPEFIRERGAPIDERFPDREAVCAEIVRLQSAGQPLRGAALAAAGLSRFMQHARSLFGSWHAALTAAGITAQHLRTHRARYGEREAVLAEIRRRHSARAPLNATVVWKSDQALGRASRLFFGTWDAALTAAGVAPESVRKHQRGYLTPAAAIAAIQQRRAARLPLHFKGVAIDEHGDHRLAQAAVRYFRTWDAALWAAGIDPAEVRLASPSVKSRFPTKQALAGEIQRLHAAGVPLQGGRLGETQQAFHRYARRLFGSWDAALRAAGIDPAEIRLTSPSVKSRFPTKQAVAAEIQRLHEAGISLSAGKVRKTHQAFHRYATRAFGSWDGALRAAGIESETVFQRAPRGQ